MVKLKRPAIGSSQDSITEGNPSKSETVKKYKGPTQLIIDSFKAELKLFDRDTFCLRETRKDPLEESTNYHELTTELKAEIIKLKSKHKDLVTIITEQTNKTAHQDSKIIKFKIIIEGNVSRTNETANRICKIEEELEKIKKEEI